MVAKVNPPSGFFVFRLESVAGYGLRVAGKNPKLVTLFRKKGGFGDTSDRQTATEAQRYK